MEKKYLEIGISTGLVAMMIALLLIVQIAAPVGVRSACSAIVMVLFMIEMGFAGVWLIDK